MKTRGFQRQGTLVSFGSALVACGAATFGREPLRKEPNPCCAGRNVDSTLAAGSGGAFTLAHLLLELTCNSAPTISAY